jgi:hypothetical protein
MVVVHGTRKFLERVGEPDQAADVSTNRLGPWYATVLFWRPQVALFVNEQTLLPALVRFAPAAGVVSRFRSVLTDLLFAHGCSTSFVRTEIGEMQEHLLDRTRNRSVLGVMNEFAYLAEVYREQAVSADLHLLSLRLAETPCGPLYKTFISPDRALAGVARGEVDE